MSDRIAVMNAGRIEQVGTPEAVYEQPSTMFVADFLGVSNLMDAVAVPDGSGSDAAECLVRVGEFALRARRGDLGARGPVKIVARPERVALLAHGAERENCLPGMIERTVYVGANVQVIVRLPTGGVIQASIANTGEHGALSQGTPVAVHVPAEALRVLAPAGRPPEAGPLVAVPPADMVAAQS